MITRKELKSLRNILEARADKLKLPREYKIAKHNSRGFKVEYKHRTYVAGYNTAKG